MTQNRIRIVDVADALGLSTATVSKVIHGKTEKISSAWIKSASRVFAKPLNKEKYIDGRYQKQKSCYRLI